MNPFDILIIMTIGLPFQQQVDLLRWWAADHPEDDLVNPSFHWWARQLPADPALGLG